MKTSKRGLDLIRRWEGCRLEAYLCPAAVWTIGYGHTGEDVHEGLVITLARAEELLRSDILEFEAAIDRCVTILLTQGQRDALTSWVFNFGETRLRSSTLLKELNAGRSIESEWMRWVHADGEVIDGLVSRRQAELQLWRGSGGSGGPGPRPPPLGADETAAPAARLSGKSVSPTPIAGRKAVAKAAKESWTIRGAGLAACGWLADQTERATGWLADLGKVAVDSKGTLDPLLALKGQVAGLLPWLFWPLVLGGIAIVIVRRLEAAAKGKVG